MSRFFPATLVTASLLALTPGCVTMKTRAPAIAVDKAAPSFTLVAEDGSALSLSELIADGPAVLVFYRGFW